jgi:hypothetical protein
MSARTGSLVPAVDRRAGVHHPKNAEATNSALDGGHGRGREVCVLQRAAHRLAPPDRCCRRSWEVALPQAAHEATGPESDRVDEDFGLLAAALLVPETECAGDLVN